MAFAGKFDFESLVHTFGLPAGVYLLLYLLTMMILIVNFFIVILDDFLAAVKASENLPRDHVVLDHLFGLIKYLIVNDKNKNRSDNGKSTITRPYYDKICVIDIKNLRRNRIWLH